MVSVATERYQAATRQTPEGRAFYLLRYGKGYLVGSRAERAIRLFLAWESLLMAAIGLVIVQLPLPLVVRFLAAGVAGGVFHTIVLRALLVASPRTAVRWMPPEPGPEPAEPTFADTYQSAVLSMAAVVFLALFAIFSSSIVDKIGFGLADVALVGYGAVVGIRRLRAERHAKA